MKKVFLFLFMVVLFIGLVSSALLGPYKQGTDVNLIQTCDDCTFNNITSILYPNGTIAISNVQMTRDGTFFNYTLDSNYTQALGVYIVSGVGNLGGLNTVWSYDFEITYGGIDLSTSQAIIYVILIVIIIFTFVGIFFAIGLLPNSNVKDEEGRIMSISYLKYLRSSLWFVEYALFVSILFLSSNLAFAFLGEQLFAQTLLVLFRISLGLTPVIMAVWVGWIILKVIEDKKTWNNMRRGLYSQGGKF